MTTMIHNKLNDPMPKLLCFVFAKIIQKCEQWHRYTYISKQRNTIESNQMTKGINSESRFHLIFILFNSLLSLSSSFWCGTSLSNKISYGISFIFQIFSSLHHETRFYNNTQYIRQITVFFIWLSVEMWYKFLKYIKRRIILNYTT